MGKGARRQIFRKLVGKYSRDDFKTNSVINGLFLGALINCAGNPAAAHLIVRRRRRRQQNICPQPPLQADVGKLAIVEMPL